MHKHRCNELTNDRGGISGRKLPQPEREKERGGGRGGGRGGEESVSGCRYGGGEKKNEEETEEEEE